MNLLAFDSSTDTLSIAVQRGDAVWQHTAPGGPQASAALIPAIQRLLAEAEERQRREPDHAEQRRRRLPQQRGEHRAGVVDQQAVGVVADPAALGLPAHELQ